MKKFLISCGIVLAGIIAFGALLNSVSPAEYTSTDTNVSDSTPATRPAEKATPTISKARQNAVKSAQGYVDLMDFSKAGLEHQLSSAAGDKYKLSDAKYAVNHIKVDWNKEALGSAKSYQELMPMSRSGLIHQLTSSAGDKYTKAQATYAVNKLGL